MTTRLLVLLASLTIFLASSASAHRPYDVPDGTLPRADGTTISVVEYYTDGIIFADPVSVQFRLPDGSVLASTGFASDVALRRPSSGSVEAYQFEGTFFPVASHVYRFDGYSLSDVTSASRRSFSPLVNTGHHWRGYVIALAVAAFFVAVWFGARAIPRRGCWSRCVFSASVSSSLQARSVCSCCS